jgi:prepilin-type N-terminal cleavage/methylation domain-containing protein
MSARDTRRDARYKPRSAPRDTQRITSRAAQRTPRRRGFTLLELLVVLVLFAITAAAAVPAFLANGTASEERSTATAIAMALTRVRDGARESGAPATLVLAPAESRMWLVWRDSTVVEQIPLAPGVRLAASKGERVECRFAPAGPATPFTISVLGRVTLAVHVDAWSGEITIGDGAPT